MKKTIIIGICILVLISFTIAVDLLIEHLPLDREDKELLAEKGITDPDFKAYAISDDVRKICLVQEGGGLNTCKHITVYKWDYTIPFDESSKVKVYYSEEEIQTMYKQWRENRLLTIANAQRERVNINPTLIEESKITITINEEWYRCESRDLNHYCDSLSGGLGTRCYFEETYMVCDEGWVLMN